MIQETTTLLRNTQHAREVAAATVLLVLSAMGMVLVSCGGGAESRSKMSLPTKSSLEAQIQDVVNHYRQLSNAGRSEEACRLLAEEVRAPRNYSNGSCEASQAGLRFKRLYVTQVVLDGDHATGIVVAESNADTGLSREAHYFWKEGGQWKLGGLVPQGG